MYIVISHTDMKKHISNKVLLKIESYTLRQKRQHCLKQSIQNIRIAFKLCGLFGGKTFYTFRSRVSLCLAR